MTVALHHPAHALELGNTRVQAASIHTRADAIDIAREHCRWAEAVGMTAGEVCQSVGRQPTGWPRTMEMLAQIVMDGYCVLPAGRRPRRAPVAGIARAKAVVEPRRIQISDDADRRFAAAMARIRRAA